MSRNRVEQVPLRRLVTCLDSKRIPLNAEERAAIAGSIPYWGANGVVDYVNRPLFDEKLVLLGEDGAPFFESGRDVAFLVDQPIWVNNHIHVLRPQGVDPRFLTYALNAVDYGRYITGSTRDKLTQEDLRRIEIWCPRPNEQRHIADFLDVELGRLSKTVSSQTRLKALLGERREALVHSYATGSHYRGERRSSNLDWGKSFPENWRVVPLKHVARLGSGHTPSRTQPAYWEDCHIPWISLFDVGRMRNPRQERLFETTQQISELGMANSSACLHSAGTVVLSRTASVGFATIMGADMAVSQHFVTWTCGPNLLPDYLLFVLRSMKQYFESVQVGTTNVTVFMPDLYAIRVPLPSIAEQRAIVTQIREETAVIDDLDDAITRQLDLLSERRQALITAAVTGQIDVMTARGVDA